MITPILKFVTGILKIRGGTDGTIIGNSADALKTVSVSGTPDLITTGSITALSGVVQIQAGAGQSDWRMTLSGTFTVGTTITFQGSQDGTDFVNLNGRLAGSINTVLANMISGPVTSPVIYQGNASGLKYVRAISTAFHAGDSVTVSITLSTGVGAVFMNASIPTGSNQIGYVGRISPQMTQLAAVDVNAIGTFSAAIDLNGFQNVAVVLNRGATGGNGGAVTLQVSNEGTIWSLYGASTAIATSSTASIQFSTISFRYCRVQTTTKSSGPTASPIDLYWGVN